MDEFEESQSIQILEDDIDEQYVPERGTRKSRSALEPPRENLSEKVAIDTKVREKAPILIVERPPPTNRNVTSVAPEVTMTAEVEKAEETRNPQSLWWDETVAQTVTGIIKFIVMALAVFVSLVVINPPFIQVKKHTFSDRSVLERQPASLKKAAGVAAIAGMALILVPPIYSICTSRFFPHDVMLAAGIQPKKSRR